MNVTTFSVLSTATWSTWNAWSNCSVTCGNGTRTRMRMCLYLNGTEALDSCDGGTNETEDCYQDECRKFLKPAAPSNNKHQYIRFS